MKSNLKRHASFLTGHLMAAAPIAVLALGACSSEVKGEKTEPTVKKDAGEPGGQNAVDWTTLGYDLGSTFWNKAETKVSLATAASLDKAWEFDALGGVTSTPLISGGRVYVNSTNVIALDLATGAELWRNLEVGGSSTLALENGVLYVHDAAGVVRALNASDGTEKWNYKVDENPNLVGFSSAVVTEDYVIVGGSGLEEVVIPAGTPAVTRGFVVAVNKADGTLGWKKFTVEPPGTGACLWSTVSVDATAGVVYAATGNNYTGAETDTSDAFLALNLAQGDGDFLWKQQILTGDVFVSSASNGNPDGDFGANPILFDVGGQKLAAGGAKMGDVWVVDRTTGAVIKQRNFSRPSAFKGGIFVNGAWDGTRLLFAVNQAASTGPGSETPSTGALFALDPLTLDIVWERAINGNAFGWITVANGVGFFGKDKTLQAFNTATGEVLKEFPTEATIATAPAVSDGYVIFGSGMSWIQATAGTKYYALKVP